MLTIKVHGQSLSAHPRFETFCIIVNSIFDGINRYNNWCGIWIAYPCFWKENSQVANLGYGNKSSPQLATLTTTLYCTRRDKSPLGVSHVHTIGERRVQFWFMMLPDGTRSTT
jgi:hypothetical protein